MYQTLQNTFQSLALVIVLGMLAGQASAELFVPSTAVVVLAADTSLQAAAKQVNTKYGGEVVKAETVSKEGKQVHQIRLLIDGRVKNVDIDVNSGKEL